ncbi:MAG: hypothetical protein ACAH83_17440 [Alphaproteobacteria bacterium]
MGDRFDHYNSHDDSKIAKEARAEKVKAAGPLFDDAARAKFESSIADATRLPAGDVKKVVDKIDQLSGEKDADPRGVIKEAVSAFVKKEVFVNNLAGQLAGTVETAMKQREERIQNGGKAPEQKTAAKASVGYTAPQNR